MHAHIVWPESWSFRGIWHLCTNVVSVPRCGHWPTADPHPLSEISKQDTVCRHSNMPLHHQCIWRWALPMLEGGPLCSGKHGEVGAWLNVKYKSWGQVQPQASTALACTHTCMSWTHPGESCVWFVLWSKENGLEYPNAMRFSYTCFSLDRGNSTGTKMDSGNEDSPF